VGWKNGVVKLGGKTGVVKLSGSTGAQNPYTNAVLYETKTEQWSISSHPFDESNEKGPEIDRGEK